MNRIPFSFSLLKLSGLRLLLALGVLSVFAAPSRAANVTASGYASPSTIYHHIEHYIDPYYYYEYYTADYYDSTALFTEGTADDGVTWTERVVWTPNSYADVLGNNYFGGTNPTPFATSESYTPWDGAGTYSVQLRVVDNNAPTYDYADAWFTFDVVDDEQYYYW